MAAAQQAPNVPSQQQAPVELQNVDPDALLTDPAKWQSQFEQRIAQYVNASLSAAGQPVLQQLSDTLDHQARTSAQNADIAAKYWPEVSQIVSRVPAHLRTAALYDETVTLVRGRHYKELAAEQAAKLAAAGGGIEGVGGNGAPGAPDAQAEVWQRIEATDLGKRLVEKVGKEGFRRTISAMGETLESYAEKLSNTPTQFDPETPGRWTTQLVGGKR